MDPQFVQRLHSLLEQSTAPDTNLVKAATAELNQNYYKNANCIGGLTSIIASSPNDAVRQLAAVELRKRIVAKSGALWVLVPVSEREEIKKNLPTVVFQEQNKLVRHAAARVIAAIASIEVPAGTWPTLLPLLQETSLSHSPVLREVGIYILWATLENIVDGFQEHLPALFSLFEKTLGDPESLDVRVTTVKALGTIAQYLDRDEKASLQRFQQIFPAVFQVIGQTVESDNETAARQMFDVLETLLILEVPVLSKCIPELVQFLLQCGANTGYSTELRVLALNALNWTVQYKKTKLNNLNLASAILQGLMPVTTEPEPEDLDDDAPSRSTLRVIDCLCTHLPPTQVFPPLRDLVLTYFQSPDPAKRRGAILALGISVEGCSEFITPLMDQIWPIVEAGLADPDPSVRKASCVAVSCLCEWLEDECAARHAILVPIIMNLINDPLSQKAACTALDGLLEILHDVIDQYLQLIMERLAGLLETAPLAVKSVITGAIGSAAHASKERFIPYFQPTMALLQHFLVLTGEGEEVELRGITMDAIGTFAEAVGKDLFRPFFPDMMKQAFQGIEMGSARLRECSFLLWGVLARVFGNEFAPYLPNVVPPLIASLSQAEHGDEFDLTGAASAFSTGSSPSNAITVGDEVDSDIIDLEDIDLDKLTDVNSAIAVEKEIAADTIGQIFSSTASDFLPYLEESTIQLVQLLVHYYEGIRKAAVNSLLEILRTFYDLGDYPDWQQGATPSFALTSHTQELIKHIIPPLLEMYDTEDHKSVVAGLCVGLADTLNKIGPALLTDNNDAIFNIAAQVLGQKAFCQQDPDQEEDEEAPEDQAEYDGVLISSAGDLVGALANVMGADFAPAFETFFRLISKYTKKSRSLTDRASAVGCLAEVIDGMKGAVTPHTEQLFQIFGRGLQDEEAEVVSNAAFASGLLIEHSTLDLSQQYLPLLQVLRPLFDTPADGPITSLNAKDNATGAVARMIIRNAAAVPFDQVFPIFLGALPCVHDIQENAPAYKAIFHLFHTNPQSLLPYMDQLLQVFGKTLDPGGRDTVTPEVRKELIQFIQLLNNEDPAKIQAAGLAVWL